MFRYRADDAATKYVEYEWDHVFRATLIGGVTAADPGEVSEVRWESPGPLAAEIAARPADFTPWLAGVLDPRERGGQVASLSSGRRADQRDGTRHCRRLPGTH